MEIVKQIFNLGRIHAVGEPSRSRWVGYQDKDIFPNNFAILL